MIRFRSTAGWAAGAAAIALVLSGCAVGTGGSAGDDEADYDPDAELSGELSVMGFSGVDEVATSRVEYAETELGDVEVELIEGDLDIQQFLSAVASGEPPALLYADRDQIGSLAARGAIIPLERCIDGEGIEMDQFRESAVEQVTLDGKVYGIPEFNQVQVTMANADLLAAAGVAIEDVNGSDRDCDDRGQQARSRRATAARSASSASTPSSPSSSRSGWRRQVGRCCPTTGRPRASTRRRPSTRSRGRSASTTTRAASAR